MSIIDKDRSVEIIKTGEKFEINLEKIIIDDTLNSIEVNLIKWEKSGLRIGIILKGYGYGYYNTLPYLNLQEAITEYEKVLQNIKKNNYAILILPHNQIKLYLGNDLNQLLNIPTLNEIIKF